MDALKRRQSQVASEKPLLSPVLPSKKRKSSTSTGSAQPTASTSTLADTPASLPPPKKRTKVVSSSNTPSTPTLAASSSVAPSATSRAESDPDLERKKAKRERKLARAQKREAKEARKKEKGKGKAVDVESAPAPIPPPSSSSQPKAALESNSSRISLQLEALSRLQKPFKAAKPPKASKAPVVKKKKVVKSKAGASSSSVPKPLGEAAADDDFDIIAAFLRNDPGTPAESLPKLVTEADNHAVLTGRYINATDLNKLASTMGLKFKKGVFTAAEDVIITAALKGYKEAHGLTDENIVEIIFSKGRGERALHPTFFMEITKALPDRPIIAVYHHLRRLFHPLKGQGHWSKEEDENLKAAILSVGAKWELIEPIVGRSAFDCRDRFRNYLDGNEGNRKKGPWTPQEEQKLSDLVNELQLGAGKAASLAEENEVYWSAISEKMGGTRSRAQCRKKWFDMGGVQVKPNGKDFTSTDAYILAQKLKSLDANSETEIVWSSLPDPAWKEWSGTQLLAAYNSLKKKLWHYNDLSHRQVVAGLVKAYPKPTDPDAPKISKDIVFTKSKETIEDSDSDSD